MSLSNDNEQMNVCQICWRPLGHGSEGSLSGESECSESSDGSDTGETTSCLQCEKRFHQHCLNDWLRQGRGCPNCRYCPAQTLLLQLVPDIPASLTDQLTSTERYLLCRLAVVLLVLQGSPQSEAEQTNDTHATNQL